MTGVRLEEAGVQGRDSYPFWCSNRPRVAPSLYGILILLLGHVIFVLLCSRLICDASVRGFNRSSSTRLNLGKSEMTLLINGSDMRTVVDRTSFDNA